MVSTSINQNRKFGMEQMKSKDTKVLFTFPPSFNNLVSPLGMKKLHFIKNNKSVRNFQDKKFSNAIMGLSYIRDLAPNNFYSEEFLWKKDLLGIMLLKNSNIRSNLE